jgi:hypothetical protein
VWVVGIVVALVAAGCSWGQYGHDASRAGWSPAEKVLTTSNVGQLKPLWRTAPQTAYGTQIAYGNLYAIDLLSTPKRVIVFTADGSSGCTGSPRVCTPQWSAPIATAMTANDALLGAYAVERDRIYVVGYVPAVGGTWRLEAFDAHGEQGCTGTPKTCAPLWRASWGAGSTSGGATLAVANDRVYVSTPGNPSAITVFDANGTQGCSGTAPATCTALFRTVEGSGGVIAVDATHLVASASFGSRVFDPAGVDGCSAGVCNPIRFLDLAFVSLSGGRAYAAGGASELDGTTGCTGSPPLCPSAWLTTRTGTTLDHAMDPVVAAGRSFVAEGLAPDDTTYVEAFDAAGQQGCSGAPRHCAPLAQFDTNQGYPYGVSATGTLLFASSASTPDSPPKVVAWDLAASTGCVGAPSRCVPLWAGLLDPATLAGFPAAPTVVNGLVAVGGDGGGIQVFAIPQP